MKNSQRFISSYNKIDAKLRHIYNYKTFQSFSDIVRRSAEKNIIVRKYENELIDFAQLRNAIVHKTIDEIIIAEPSDNATKIIEHIAELICTPPTVKDVFKQRKIKGVEESDSLKHLITLISRTNFSNIPVYNYGKMTGMLNTKRIVSTIGGALISGVNIDNFIKKSKCGDILDINDMSTYYALLSINSTIEQVALKFEENTKLRAVLIMENGILGEPLINMLTSFDLTTINKILEDYS